MMQMSFSRAYMTQLVYWGSLYSCPNITKESNDKIQNAIGG